MNKTEWIKAKREEANGQIKINAKSEMICSFNRERLKELEKIKILTKEQIEEEIDSLEEYITTVEDLSKEYDIVDARLTILNEYIEEVEE